jgi:hypothetical protein
MTAMVAATTTVHHRLNQFNGSSSDDTAPHAAAFGHGSTRHSEFDKLLSKIQAAHLEEVELLTRELRAFREAAEKTRPQSPEDPKLPGQVEAKKLATLDPIIPHTSKEVSPRTEEADSKKGITSVRARTTSITGVTDEQTDILTGNGDVSKQGVVARTCGGTGSRKDRWAYKVVKTTKFDMFVNFMIIINAGFIGRNMEYQIDCARDNVPSNGLGWVIMETAFVVWFSLELTLKIIAEDVLVFCGEDWAWNLLDLFLVVSAILQMAFENSFPNLSLTRTIRLLRIPRLLRVMKLIKSCQTLRVLVFSIIKSVDMLLWVMLVLLLFLYMFAVVFMNATVDQMKDNLEAAQAEGGLELAFGTVPIALLTLFKCITGGQDWGETYDALDGVGVIFGLCFLGYLYFMIFLVLNVVIGSVVANTESVVKRDKEVLVQEEMSRVKEYANDIKEFFNKADADSSGSLSRAEFVDYLHDERVKSYFQALELDTMQAQTLFDLLDNNENGEVGITEFFEGCMRLKGGAKSLDVQLAIFKLENIEDKLAELTKRL